MNYVFNGTTIMKATSYIYCDEPHAHADMFNLSWGFLHIEGGAEIFGKNLRFDADDIQIDDGGVVQVNNGGHMPNDGEGNYFSFLYMYI